MLSFIAEQREFNKKQEKRNAWVEEEVKKLRKNNNLK